MHIQYSLHFFLEIYINWFQELCTPYTSTAGIIHYPYCNSNVVNNNVPLIIIIKPEGLRLKKLRIHILHYLATMQSTASNAFQSWLTDNGLKTKKYLNRVFLIAHNFKRRKIIRFIYLLMIILWYVNKSVFFNGLYMIFIHQLNGSNTKE